MDKYLLDSNVFIQPKNTYYAFDLVPSYWNLFASILEGGRMFVTSSVFDELMHHDDELEKWIEEQSKINPNFKVDEKNDKRTFEIYSELTEQYADNPRYTAKNRHDFFEGADPWIIACASAKGMTVVSFERRAPEAKIIKVPDVCDRLGVRCIDLFQMLRELKFRL